MKTRRKRFLATAIVFLLYCMIFMPMTAAAENGYVDFFDAYDTSYEESKENLFNYNDYRFYPLPMAFLLQPYCIKVSDQEIYMIENPTEFSVKMGETITQRLDLKLGDNREMILNLSLNPIIDTLSYTFQYAYRGMYITDKAKGTAYPFYGDLSQDVYDTYDGYPCIKLDIFDHTLILRITGIIPGDLTHQSHLEYKYTEYEVIMEDETYNQGFGHSKLKSESHYTYDKGADLYRKVTEVVEDGVPNDSEYSVGDLYEYTISAGTQEPPSVIRHGDTISFTATASVVKNPHPDYNVWSNPSPLSLRIIIGKKDDEYGNEFINSDMADDHVYKSYLYTGRTTSAPEFITQDVEMSYDVDFLYSFGGGSSDLWKITVIYCDWSTPIMKVHHIYELKEPEAMVRGIAFPDMPEGIDTNPGKPTPPGSKSEIVDTKADKAKGETGVSIPEALAIVLIGGGAAFAGAGTGRNDSNDDRKKKSSYKMCLRKDFGDAIRYDTQPVTLYARIVEITPEGEEIDRPDLSSAIEIFSGENLAVESCSMAGNYMGALVSAQSIPGGKNAATGVVSIRFAGAEGSFQNNVTFRLIGKPYIAFPKQGNFLTMTLPMILGNGKVYETPVILHDFMEKPTSVRLDVAEGAPLKCELEEIEYTEAIIEDGVQNYILKVKNLSSKPEGNPASKQTFGIGIIAENDKEKAENSLNAELYPEGLSIREVKFDEKGYVVIDTFDNEATDEWGDVLPTSFVLDFVVPEQDDEGRPAARVLEPQEYSPVFAELKGTDERTTHLAERFKYSIKEVPGNLKEFKFAPEEALVEDKGKPYYLTLPVSCTYGEKEYTLDLPIRLIGGGPGPLTGWDEAFAHMKKVVSKVGGISPEIARLLRENGKKMSTKELRLVTIRICEDAKAYYTQDAEELKKISAELDNMIFYADWLKWFGDQAFSYLMTTYYGNTADAILSPAKDIFAALLGEIIDYLLSGEQITIEELEMVKNITAGVDNLIVNAFDDAISKKSISFKQICTVVAGFLIWKAAKNIYENIDEDGKVDIYSAVTSLTADLTAFGVRKIAGNFFEKAAKSSKIQKALEKPIAKWIQNLAPNTFKGRWDIDQAGEYLFKYVEFKQSEAIKKYVEELSGLGAVKAVEKVAGLVEKGAELVGKGVEAADDLLTDISETTVNSVDISAWPQISIFVEFTSQNGQKVPCKIIIDLGLEAIGKFFDYLFSELFGAVPFATEVKTPPADPPYIPEKSL